MNPYYKQCIFGIGVAAPLLVVLVLLGVVFHYRGKLEKTYKSRKVEYAKFQQYEQQREELEKKVSEQDPHMVRWMTIMDEPSSSAVNEFIGEAQKKYEGQEFQLTSFRRATASGGIGAASGQSSVQLDLAFRGTFSALQHTFIELETKMPQLQLDRMKLIPQSGGNVLEAKLLYTAWEKKE